MKQLVVITMVFVSLLFGCGSNKGKKLPPVAPVTPKGTISIQIVRQGSQTPEQVKSITILRGKEEIHKEINVDSYAADGLNYGAYTVEVIDFAGRKQSSQRNLQADLDTCTFSIPPYPVSISLISRDTQKPVLSEARIKVTDASNKAQLFVAGKDSPELPSGTYTVTVSAEGYLNYPDANNLPKVMNIPQELKYLFELKPDLIKYQFRIVDEITGEEVSPAYISVYDQDQNWLDELNYPDEYTRDLPVASYVFLAEAAGYEYNAIQYPAPKTRNETIEFLMSRKKNELSLKAIDAINKQFIPNPTFKIKGIHDQNWQIAGDKVLLLPGDYDVKISAPGYVNRDARISLTGNMTKEWELERRKYELEFRLNTSARIKRNGQEINAGTTKLQQILEPGNYNYEFSMDKYESQTRVINVTQEKLNKQESLEIIPIALKKKTGKIRITLKDSFSNQKISGEIKIGSDERKNVSEEEFTLEWGDYQVSASAPGRDAKTVTVTVEAGETPNLISIGLSQKVIAAPYELNTKDTPGWKDLLVGIKSKGINANYRFDYTNENNQPRFTNVIFNEKTPYKRLGEIIGTAKYNTVIRISAYGG